MQFLVRAKSLREACGDLCFQSLAMNHHCYDLAIRVLLSKEDGQFVAHALELDLVAYGDTEKEVRKSLHDAIVAQLTFAAQM